MHAYYSIQDYYKHNSAWSKLLLMFTRDMDYGYASIIHNIMKRAILNFFPAFRS